jgi:hypothetical protein
VLRPPRGNSLCAIDWTLTLGTYKGCSFERVAHSVPVGESDYERKAESSEQYCGAGTKCFKYCPRLQLVRTVTVINRDKSYTILFGTFIDLAMTILFI